jgi:hypothetical protein
MDEIVLETSKGRRILRFMIRFSMYRAYKNILGILPELSIMPMPG